MYGPKCPNHGCPLTGLPFPMKSTGSGRCAISGVVFEYEIDLDESKAEMKKDAQGNITKVQPYKVTGND